MFRAGVTPVQDSLESPGTGFGSASAGIILLRIPALFVPLRSALSERPPDVQRPRGAFIRWELTPATDTYLFLTACRGGSLPPSDKTIFSFVFCVATLGFICLF